MSGAVVMYDAEAFPEDVSYTSIIDSNNNFSIWVRTDCVKRLGLYALNTVYNSIYDAGFKVDEKLINKYLFKLGVSFDRLRLRYNFSSIATKKKYLLFSIRNNKLQVIPTNNPEQLTDA